MNDITFMQVPQTGGSSGETNLIAAIARWCESLQGRGTILRAISDFAESIGAEAATLSRVSRSDDRETRCLTVDLVQGKPEMALPERSFAQAVMGPYFATPKGGSIWLKSMIDCDPDPELSMFQRRRHLAELAIIPLDVADKHVDFLELHFHNATNQASYGLLNMVGPTLAQTWKSRVPGLLTDTMLRRTNRRKEMPQTAPILSVDNPARLSRAEYRVCLLLSRGMSTKDVREELGITISTLRSHLRNIFAKTGAGNQTELLYQLMSAEPVSPEVQERNAKWA